MKPYKVLKGVGEIGPGEVIGLTRAQLTPRAEDVSVMQHLGETIVCRANHKLQFDLGEIILLPYAPPRSMEEIIVPAADEAELAPEASLLPAETVDPEPEPLAPKGKGKVRKAD